MRGHILKIAPACALVTALALASAQPVMAQGMLLTSNGEAIESHPAETLTCGELTEKLNAIDETGYRSGRPEPSDTADLALYEYERKLSVEFFWRCATRVDGQGQNDAFKSGFLEQKNQ